MRTLSAGPGSGYTLAVTSSTRIPTSSPSSRSDIRLCPTSGPQRDRTGGYGRDMADQSLSEQARDAVLTAILTAAPKVVNSPAGVRDLAEAYALVERNLIPNAGVVQNKT